MNGSRRVSKIALENLSIPHVVCRIAVSRISEAVGEECGRGSSAIRARPRV